MGKYVNVCQHIVLIMHSFKVHYIQGAQHKVNVEAIMLVTLLNESETQTGNY